ncbi:polysaccharide lyase family 1 protein [Streptomyces sp. NPDC021020]|uniref:polysaccharide lyase family 1 protein n=1 Tax=Streptomyces sp. NPDC021020 TaxID=3365109 RepID=UPI00379CC760
MRRAAALQIGAVSATLALAVATGAVLLGEQASAAATASGASGYASQNGGTTGGAGGQTVKATTGAEINAALCNRASTSTPITIQVEGTINHGNTAKASGSCSTADDVIDLKQISNVTIEGVGSGAVFDQLGIHVRESSNIIIQNVTVQNVKKSGSPTSNGGDAIGMETDVHNVWVDHVSLLASGGEDEGYDSLFDLKHNTQYVTLSYSTLRNSGRGGLVGSSDSDLASSFITYHHDLYENIDSRAPLLRGGTAHSYDNYYVSLNKSGINPRAGAHAKIENNYFKDSKDVIGTFYTDLMGYWQVSGNIYDNVTWTADGSENHPAGPDPQSNTTVSIPYSYTMDAASCVPSVVTRTAGAGKGLLVSDGNCSTQSPTAPPTTPTPSTSTTSSPTTPPTQPAGTNLSLASGAGADGSSKASGTSYGNVRDGDLGTYWSPSGTTGSVSVKWGSATAVSSAVIRESAGATGRIGAWSLVDADTGAVLKSGSGAGTISFPKTSLKKITFQITGASGTPQVAEFETYA